jgi:hypothetical protein
MTAGVTLQGFNSGFLAGVTLQGFNYGFLALQQAGVSLTEHIRSP